MLKNKIKVAIVYHYLAHYRLPIFQELMKNRQIEYTLYSGITSEINIKKIDFLVSKKTIEEGGLRWKLLNNVWILNGKILFQKGLLNVAFQQDYDAYIFLGNPFHISTWIASLIAKMRKKKVFYWMHGHYKSRLSLKDYIKVYIFYKLPDGFFLYGKRSFEQLMKLKIKPPSDMHIIYNSLNYEKSLELRKVLDIKELKTFRNDYFNDKETPIIIFIGRLNKIKKIDLLLYAQKKLLNKNNRNIFNTLIIGSGEERDNLERLASELGLSENIKFYGESYNEENNSYLLTHSDLCVTPGEVGLTAIHALSYGTPVISHNNFDIQMPEVEAILPGVTGDLFVNGNINNLAIVIEKWLQKYPAKNEKLMRDCFNIIDTFYNPKYQAFIFNQVFENLYS